MNNKTTNVSRKTISIRLAQRLMFENMREILKEGLDLFLLINFVFLKNALNSRDFVGLHHRNQRTRKSSTWHGVFLHWKKMYPGKLFNGFRSRISELTRILPVLLTLKTQTPSKTFSNLAKRDDNSTLHCSE
jgi:hypothetical protein